MKSKLSLLLRIDDWNARTLCYAIGKSTREYSVVIQWSFENIQPAAA